MEKNKINKIENAMRKYYEEKKLLRILNIKLRNLNNDIKCLKNKIDLGKIELNSDLKAQNYDYIGSSSKANNGIEFELEKAYFKLEKLLEKKKLEALETENKIYDIKTKVECIDESLEGQLGINSTLKEVLDLRYNRKYSMKYIANKFYCGAIATAYRDRDKVLESVEAIVRLNGKDIFC